MDRLFSFIGDIADPVKGGGDTFTDRLNCRYTPCILLVLALIITTKQYVGEPIACWCPDHFTHAQIEYTNQVRGFCLYCSRYIVATKKIRQHPLQKLI